MDWQDQVEINPNIKGGKPVVKGTRVPVEVAVGAMAGGASWEEVMGGTDCDHQPRGYYSYAATDSAWQEDWGTDEEWDEWARATG